MLLSHSCLLQSSGLNQWEERSNPETSVNITPKAPIPRRTFPPQASPTPTQPRYKAQLRRGSARSP